MRPIHKLPGAGSLAGLLLMRGASAAVAIKANMAAVTAPGVTDDDSDGYAPGSMWVDTAGQRVFICADATTNAAVWKEVSASSAGRGFGVFARTLTTGTVTLQVEGTDCDENQVLSGELSGAVVINVLRTNAIRGDTFRLRLNGVKVTAAFTLTVQENGAGSLAAWVDEGTVTGHIMVGFTGGEWVILEESTVLT